MIPDWPEERRKMIRDQLFGRAIRDARVLDAMGAIPREEFVPADHRLLTYGDDPVPIGYGQTISQPYMTALMMQELELKGFETVLEVGAGCGYAAAVLGALARTVISIEIVPALVAMARDNLRRTGRDGNVQIVEGDGSLGYAALAPYDAISVAAGAPHVPTPLLNQLADPGVLVIPVGELDDQQLRIIRKQEGRIEHRMSTYCRFVPLRGGEGWN
ncbi:MAG TPA: protein-L-isoaspartate O-methyltransferase [Verrucomicrobiae bacterium]|nr:protein-L-isoaspartate O-methyltransferase [Verrucomicrobiae bacterium]